MAESTGAVQGIEDIPYSGYVFDRGAFRQRDLTVRRVYDDAYLARYREIDANVRALSAKRLKVLEAFVPRGTLLDFGCGTGRFVEAARAHGWDAHGCDVIPSPGVLDPAACEGDGWKWDVVTFFDSLEHLEAPDRTIQALSPAWVMVSVPWCHYPGIPEWFMNWRHRRPGEHLWHWTATGLDWFFHALDYRDVMHSTFEDEYRPNPEQVEPNILTAIYRKA